jgi:hypothetical protein
MGVTLQGLSNKRKSCETGADDDEVEFAVVDNIGPSGIAVKVSSIVFSCNMGKLRNIRHEIILCHDGR